MEVNAYPVAFVHVITRRDALVSVAQLFRFIGLAFQVAIFETVQIYKAEPLAAHLKDEQVAVFDG